MKLVIPSGSDCLMGFSPIYLAMTVLGAFFPSAMDLSRTRSSSSFKLLRAWTKASSGARDSSKSALRSRVPKKIRVSVKASSGRMELRVQQREQFRPLVELNQR